MNQRAIKGAETASVLGAGAVGAGLALLAPALLSRYAIALLVAGLLVHGAGMTLKRRFEQAAGEPLWWETALFWSCWFILGALAAGVLARVLTA